MNTPRPVESGVNDRVSGYVIEPHVEILYSPLHLAPSHWMGQRYVQQLMQDDEAPMPDSNFDRDFRHMAVVRGLCHNCSLCVRNYPVRDLIITSCAP